MNVEPSAPTALSISPTDVDLPTPALSLSLTSSSPSVTYFDSQALDPDFVGTHEGGELDSSQAASEQEKSSAPESSAVELASSSSAALTASPVSDRLLLRGILKSSPEWGGRELPAEISETGTEVEEASYSTARPVRSASLPLATLFISASPETMGNNALVGSSPSPPITSPTLFDSSTPLFSSNNLRSLSHPSVSVPLSPCCHQCSRATEYGNLAGYKETWTLGAFTKLKKDRLNELADGGEGRSENRTPGTTERWGGV